MTTKTEQEISFQSRSPNQKVVITPGRPERLDGQNRVLSEAVRPKRVEFKPCLTDDPDSPVRSAGTGTGLVGLIGRYTTSDPEEIAALRANPLFATAYGWFEETPEADNELAAITEATASGDTKAIEKILAAEHEGYERPEVIAQGEAALAAIEKAQPKKAKKPAGKKAAAKPEGKAKASETESAEAETAKENDGDSGVSAGH